MSTWKRGDGISPPLLGVSIKSYLLPKLAFHSLGMPEVYPVPNTYVLVRKSAG